MYTYIYLYIYIYMFYFYYTFRKMDDEKSHPTQPILLRGSVKVLWVVKGFTELISARIDGLTVNQTP